MRSACEPVRARPLRLQASFLSLRPPGGSPARAHGAERGHGSTGGGGLLGRARSTTRAFDFTRFMGAWREDLVHAPVVWEGDTFFMMASPEGCTGVMWAKLEAPHTLRPESVE